MAINMPALTKKWRAERGWWREKTNIRVLSVSVKGRSLGDVMKEKRLQWI